jgi:hypothetical protein
MSQPPKDVIVEVTWILRVACKLDRANREKKDQILEKDTSGSRGSSHSAARPFRATAASPFKA